MFTRLLQFAKMSWMIYWRLFVVTAIFFSGKNHDIFPWIAMGVAAISVFVFNRTFLTWPVLRFLTGKRNVIPANTWAPENQPMNRKTRRGTSYSPHRGPGRPHVGTPGTLSQPNYITTATQNGRMTGYEPRSLETMPVPDYATMIGKPGEGLHTAAGMSQQNIQLGVQGEENFARALASSNQLRRFTTVWSVPVPDQNLFVPGPYETDIDCVLATETAVFLIDLKNYKSGNVVYTHSGNQLFCQDVATGQQVGAAKTMTKNMEMATQAMRTHFPQVNFVPVVVFMPTDKGEGVIDGVTWPGGIPAMNLSDFIEVLNKQNPFHWKLPHSGAVGRIGHLTKMNASKVKY